jgi:hypothetical protein
VIKVYPTEVEAVEDMRKVFTLSMREENVFHLETDTLICNRSLDDLFNAIRKAVELMEIERTYGE